MAEKQAAKADDGSNYSYGGIVCAVLSIFILGIPLSALAIILGAIGFSKGDKTKGIIAIVLGIVMLGLSIMSSMMLAEMGFI